MKRIGLVGYSNSNFNTSVAKTLMEIAFMTIQDKIEYKNEDFSLISGLTNVGIPAIGYELATKKGWKTVGIACEKAEEYECFKVDKKIIVGTEWGDESETFLMNIDILVRIGGGKQSIAETKKAKEMNIETLEYDLPQLPKI
jgi:hypothetical protein